MLHLRTPLSNADATFEPGPSSIQVLRFARLDVIVFWKLNYIDWTFCNVT